MKFFITNPISEILVIAIYLFMSIPMVRANEVLADKQKPLNVNPKTVSLLEEQDQKKEVLKKVLKRIDDRKRL